MVNNFSLSYFSNLMWLGRGDRGNRGQGKVAQISSGQSGWINFSGVCTPVAKAESFACGAATLVLDRMLQWNPLFALRFKELPHLVRRVKQSPNPKSRWKCELMVGRVDKNLLNFFLYIIWDSKIKFCVRFSASLYGV